MTDSLYKNVSCVVDKWLEVHDGETFDLDTICRQVDAKDRETRQYVAIKLAYEVKKGKLEKLNRLYKCINDSIEYIDWVNASEKERVPFSWPSGRDGSEFPFAGKLTVRPTDLIVIAGVSNMGKSGFCKNLIWENMDEWNGRITYMVNEYQPARFKRSVNLMDWNTPFNSDGTLKFEVIRRDEDWQYAVNPDHLNIIDWVSMEGDFYRIGKIMKAIQAKLRDGVAVVVTQKGEGKDLGTGGQFGEHFASYYIAIDFGRLFFKKAKEYHGHNPNNKHYGFDLSEGVYFNNLREVTPCGQCKATGKKWNSKEGKLEICAGCMGSGYFDR